MLAALPRADEVLRPLGGLAVAQRQEGRRGVRVAPRWALPDAGARRVQADALPEQPKVLVVSRPVELLAAPAGRVAAE